MTYAELFKILSEIFVVPVGHTSTFESRVKQLQRLGFPKGVRIGRGQKMDYTDKMLWELAVCFELINSGLPAATAVQAVQHGWKYADREQDQVFIQLGTLGAKLRRSGIIVDVAGLRSAIKAAHEFGRQENGWRKTSRRLWIKEGSAEHAN